MKCFNCGAELTDDSKFCSYCGVKIAGNVAEPAWPKAGTGRSDIPQGEPVPASPQNYDTQKTQRNGKSKAKPRSFWSGLDLFCKVVTVSIAVAFVLLVITVCSGKSMAILLSVFQLAGMVVALLMHKGTIKLEQKQKWIEYLTLAVSILLIALTIMSYSWGQDSKPRNAPNQNQTGYQTPTVSTTVFAPYGAADCIGKDHSIVQSDFYNTGFESVEVEKVEDLQSIDADKVGTVESIFIDDENGFSQGQEFDKDSKVVIRYHAYRKCDVKLHIDFIPNLVFSTYDVKLLVNGEDEGTLEHGKDKDFQLSIDPGEYTLAFLSTESSSVKGEISLTVDSDIEASYKISCYRDRVSVETQYVDRLTKLTADEAKIMRTAQEYIGKDYQEVVDDLHNAGFVNITAEPVYDIAFGITPERSTSEVTIDGSVDFQRGKVFSKDVKVIVKYHMKMTDNPTSQTDETASPAENGNSLTPSPAPTSSPSPLATATPKAVIGYISAKSLNLRSEPSTESDIIAEYKNGQIVSILGDSGDWYNVSVGDNIGYMLKEYITKETEDRSEESVPNVSTNIPDSGNDLAFVENITVNNNDKFAALMGITDQTDADTIRAFTNAHIGRVIEFDGCIALMMNHKKYKTRFDVCMVNGNYDAKRVYGPLFAFEDVNFYDMNVSGTDTVAEGMNFRIRAEIKRYNAEGGYILLKPVSLKKR